MQLNDLSQSSNRLNPEITGLTADSRSVQSGYLFAALPGTKVDGTDFLQAAIKRGASAVLVPSSFENVGEVPDQIAILRSDNVKKTFAELTARFFGDQPKHLAAVTGTNGKTSVAWFTQHLWHQLGHKSASFGTLGAIPKDITQENIALTTPDTITLHKAIRDAKEQQVSHLVFEASSHGLEQHRLDGLAISSAAFTNFSRDHIDYHGTMEAYFEAKARLFSEVLPKTCTAVLNADVPEFPRLQQLVGHSMSYGCKSKDIQLTKQRPTLAGQELSLNLFDRKLDIVIPLIGSFQAMNVLCSMGLMIAEGEDVDNVIPLLPGLTGVPGRLEQTATDASGQKSVVVDYAHTPDALENAIKSLRPHCDNRLIVVFGCGGDRDRGKRPEMGTIAEQLSDIAIIADDNPRSEDPGAIRAEIKAKAPSAMEISDREAAIFEALSLAKAGDIVLVAGKGHETGQTVGENIIPFDDKEVTQRAAQDLWN